MINPKSLAVLLLTFVSGVVIGSWDARSSRAHSTGEVIVTYPSGTQTHPGTGESYTNFRTTKLVPRQSSGTLWTFDTDGVVTRYTEVD